ncbi:unnamed protein product [Euphydryas editha]|uniref:Uncharacterized protein n=2 Tax=Euphydryas editha TaxID=104508 RepID=A0AAU9TG44_EUPED|nr:unnamed protein product [Euphydryas editha]
MISQKGERLMKLGDFTFMRELFAGNRYSVHHSVNEREAVDSIQPVYILQTFDKKWYHSMNFFKGRKRTREEILEQQRLRKRQVYAEIKKDPERYAEQKEKERLKYLKKKEQKKVKLISDMTPEEKKEQRKRWRERSVRAYRRRKTTSQ